LRRVTGIRNPHITARTATISIVTQNQRAKSVSFKRRFNMRQKLKFSGGVMLLLTKVALHTRARKPAPSRRNRGPHPVKNDVVLGENGLVFGDYKTVFCEFKVVLEDFDMVFVKNQAVPAVDGMVVGDFYIVLAETVLFSAGTSWFSATTGWFPTIAGWFSTGSRCFSAWKKVLPSGSAAGITRAKSFKSRCGHGVLRYSRCAVRWRCFVRRSCFTTTKEDNGQSQIGSAQSHAG
jgi:hypothetical protein